VRLGIKVTNKLNMETTKLFVSVPENSDSSVSGSITGARISSDHSVIWQWTHLPDGRSAVTGYTIKLEL